jgi:hypothetical protein
LDDLNRVRDIAGFKARDEIIPQLDLGGEDDETGEDDGAAKKTGKNGKGKPNPSNGVD